MILPRIIQSISKFRIIWKMLTHLSNQMQIFLNLRTYWRMKTPLIRRTAFGDSLFLGLIRPFVALVIDLATTNWNADHLCQLLTGIHWFALSLKITGSRKPSLSGHFINTLWTLIGQAKGDLQSASHYKQLYLIKGGEGASNTHNFQTGVLKCLF